MTKHGSIDCVPQLTMLMEKQALHGVAKARPIASSSGIQSGQMKPCNAHCAPLMTMGMIVTNASMHVAVLDRPFDALWSCFIELVSVAVVRIDDDS